MSGASGMAAAPDGRTRLYWESTGEGDPVLLIMGLGLSGGAWWRTVDALSPTMRVITFDHRGIGRSETLMPAYTTESMADDAASILHEFVTRQATNWWPRVPCLGWSRVSKLVSR